MNKTAVLTAAVAVMAFVSLAAAMAGMAPSLYRPADVFSGHRAFSTACQACHAPWAGPQDARCLGCHGRFAAQGPHALQPRARPAKAAVPASLNNAGCVTCHREHRSADVNGYTGPARLCVECHPAGRLNPLHKGYQPESCALASCHSYHANLPSQAARDTERMLSASMIVARAAPAEVKDREPAASFEAMYASAFYRNNPAVAAQYVISPHNGAVTCDGCHRASGDFEPRPPLTVCRRCHERQGSTYFEGLHGAGFRFASGAPDGAPCGACHDGHAASLKESRRGACLRCHVAEHTAAYEKSGHSRYLTDPALFNKPMTGVDCAGCHLPRRAEFEGATDHNETLAASSRELMASVVCARCHGVGFALAALYQPDGARSSFIHSPSQTPPGLAHARRAFEAAP